MKPYTYFCWHIWNIKCMKYINKTLKTHSSSAFKFSNYPSHHYSWLRSLQLIFSFAQIISYVWNNLSHFSLSISKHKDSFFFSLHFSSFYFMSSYHLFYRSSGMSGSLGICGGHTTPLVGGKGGFGKRSLSILFTVSCKEAYFSWRALCSASFLWP